MKVHDKALVTLCRLCARKISKTGQQRPPKDCIALESKIWEFYGIKIEKSAFVPSKFCLRCYKRIMNAKYTKVRSNDATDKQEHEEINRIQRINQIWKPHCDTSCIVCKVFKIYAKGGKPTSIERAVSQILDNLPIQYHSNQPDSPPSHVPCDLDATPRGSNLQTPNLSLQDPVFTPKSWKTPQKQKIYSECMTQTTPKQLLIDSLKRNVNSPLDKSEEKVNTHNIRRKLATSSDGKTAACKTGGRVRPC